MASERYTIRLSPDAHAVIGEGTGLSARINTVALRYGEVVTRCRPAFTQAQWSAIFDALNGTILEPDTIAALWMDVRGFEGLGDKWNIDQDALTNELRSMDYGQLVAVAEAVERFWDATSAGSGDVVMEECAFENRRLNLQAHFADGAMPKEERSYLSQLMSGKAQFGERAARRIEKDYGMEEGALDRPFMYDIKDLDPQNIDVVISGLPWAARAVIRSLERKHAEELEKAINEGERRVKELTEAYRADFEMKMRENSVMAEMRRQNAALLNVMKRASENALKDAITESGIKVHSLDIRTVKEKREGVPPYREDDQGNRIFLEDDEVTDRKMQ